MKKDWPAVKLGEVLRLDLHQVPVQAGSAYPNVGIYSFGRGMFGKPDIDGATTSATTLYRIRAGQLIYSRLFAFEGAYALVPPAFDGYFVSNEFPTFEIDTDRANPAYIGWLFHYPRIWGALSSSSTGLGDRRQRVHPEGILEHRIKLPSLYEQRRIIAQIEELAAQIREARTLREEIEDDLNVMVASACNWIAKNAPRRTLGEVAPLLRRPVAVEFEKTYPQIAVRSFGRGTFHKPPLVGSEVTWEKPFLVRAGDILVSNIKAWEGALAVAKPEDDRRVGSHRYLTCVPIEGIARARFICSYLLSPEGLHGVGEASPGSADRNRTLNSKAFMQISVPVPEYSKQIWFDSICEEADQLKQLQAETAAELDALLPSILDRAFCGAL